MNRSQLRAISRYQSLATYRTVTSARAVVQASNAAAIGTPVERDAATGKQIVETADGGSVEARFISTSSVPGTLPSLTLGGSNYADSKPS